MSPRRMEVRHSLKLIVGIWFHGMRRIQQLIKRFRHLGQVILRLCGSIQNRPKFLFQSCKIPRNHLKQNIFFVLEIAVHDPCGNACLFCNFRRVGLIIAFPAKKLIARLNDSVPLFDRTLLLGNPDFRHGLTYLPVC